MPAQLGIGPLELVLISSVWKFLAYDNFMFEDLWKEGSCSDWKVILFFFSSQDMV